ncbi:MAG: bifunctional 5,10-methylenetetrahydrofolate dehydrogenase/5,10-methenyltetrahydrofolate cyclohydrolase [Candidatus Thalassarchaeaceae archaeon]|nr:bifunctional 5,10-methylene-tetrahydrofolate dehydrogenase/5,10-methylene-tetrahydrofolate cyclohydrolase [Euryarchaeota archaeon]MDP7256592.1 bifunctional 5,10-methylenetetrahydrofolate dehydrogenase/5,10-methenyltetrahydrofolate cyclohydrolase [Candidatus Thalassarchaeaceae archaeon]MDP7648574.1 bifunctional 5,10-methylenetetrahydrofolate dehydrogenase/5,10-methenyltetrahydrofolate cyclohydrolase [Candidatus Thalassarchaeaceae archaeon]HJL54651.1 bifunctional 5,10-methylenetetrahydrofolate 
MSATKIDGKAISLEIEGELKVRVDALGQNGVQPHLVVVLVGDDAASHVYVRNKQRACERTGIESTLIDLPSTSTQKDILELISDLNGDESVHGILVQSPLPLGIDEFRIAEAIGPGKDVDGFHPANLGRLVQGDTGGMLPCTPAGVMRLLEGTGVDLTGSKAVVLGRSRIVGMPMALLLTQKGVDATVTIVHSRSEEPSLLCRDADLLVSAIGRPWTIKPGWVKPGAIVIDVGISRIEDGSTPSGSRLAGDVDPSVSEVAGWLTPVPGGVGPMTIAMLLKNTVRAAEGLLP